MIGRNIRQRLLVLTILVLLVSLIGSMIIASRAFSITLTQNTASKLANDASYIAQAISGNGGSYDEQMLIDYARNTQVRITLIDHDGVVLFDSDYDTSALDNHGTRDEVAQARISGTGTSQRYSATEDVNVLYHAIRVEDNSKLAFIRVSAHLAQLKLYNETYQKLLLGGLGLLLAITVVVTVFSIRKITRPLQEIHLVAERYADGDLSARSAVDSPMELAVLSTTMNHMAGQLQTQINSIETRQQQYLSILNSMTEGILSIDRRMTIVEANHAAGHLLLGESGSPDQLIGRRIVQITGSSGLLSACDKTLSGSGIQVFEIPHFKHLFGETAALMGKRQASILRIAVHPVMDGSVVTGLVMTVNDITELKRLENMRKEFVANVSHELKTPITAIGGFSAALLEGALDDPETAKRFVRIINRQAEQMRRIVEDLLLLSSLEQQNASPTRTWTAVSQVTDETIEACRFKIDEKGSTVEVSIDNPLDREMYVNGMLIVQALSNLIINALTYSDPGSTVELAVEMTEQQAIFRVTDHGFGIPKDAQERIFERFYRVDKARSRQQGGTGLGLSIVKHIVQVHGGIVTVESEEGTGSTFTVILPRSGGELDQLHKKSSQLFDGLRPRTES